MDSPRLKDLMERGSPVCVSLSHEDAPTTDALFCELVQRARYGESFHISSQGCPVGSYILGKSDASPRDYYAASGRYRDKRAAGRAANVLPRLQRSYTSIRIFPYGDSPEFLAVILFLRPAKAMLVVQALSFNDGRRVVCANGGTASVCGDCTAYPIETHRAGISVGCRGSRKHSGYGDEEMVVGVPHTLVEKIESGLERLLMT
ncbi:MAG TPA: protein clustered with O-phosphoseryl-tRNA(Cys) synthetase [Candidatus Methanoperedenaceae archaeon]|nr:protein clustered with O-phosphoseryl-tRNA(Cys) synthetase [Candidatus Methanoperedenaceae archaeon]